MEAKTGDFRGLQYSCPALLDGDERCRQCRAAEDAPSGLGRDRFPGPQRLDGLTVERDVARLSRFGPFTADRDHSSLQIYIAPA
jgi:hypothetical protein